MNPVTVPASVTVYLAAREECLRVAGLEGVTQERKGRSAVRAVNAICGVDKGTTWRKAWNSDGAEGCSELSSTHPSSALLLACSQALEATSASTAPPTRPWASGLTAVSQVLTAMLLLESSW